MNAQKLQSSVESAGQFHLFMNDRDHQISGHRVGTRAVEVFDSQMLLDPSEEQLDAPARLVEHGHFQRRDLQVVGEEDQFPFRFRVVVAHFSQESGKGISRFGQTGLADMVAAQAGEAIHRQRVVPGELQFALGPCDEEDARLGDEEKAGEIHVAAIHQIESSGLEQQAVEPANIVLARSGDVNTGWNRLPQVDLGVHLDARPGLAHEALGKILPEPPVALFVGIRESGLGHRLAKPEVMQGGGLCIETGRNAKPLAPGQLGEDHADELLAATKVTDIGFCVVAFDEAGKCLPVDQIEKLGENVAAGIHGRNISQTKTPGSNPSHRKFSANHSLFESYK